MSLYVTAGKVKKLWRTDDDSALYEVKNLWTDAGKVFSSGPTIEVHNVTMGGLIGKNVFHPLLTLSPPAGRAWHVQIEGTFAPGGRDYPGRSANPLLTIGGSSSVGWERNQSATFSGEIASTNPRVGVTTRDSWEPAPLIFSGTITVTKP